MTLSWVSSVRAPAIDDRRHNVLTGYPLGNNLDVDEKTAAVHVAGERAVGGLQPRQERVSGVDSDV